MIFPASFFSFILSAFLKNRVALHSSTIIFWQSGLPYTKKKDAALDALSRTRNSPSSSRNLSGCRSRISVPSRMHSGIWMLPSKTFSVAANPESASASPDSRARRTGVKAIGPAAISRFSRPPSSFQSWGG